MSDPLIDRARLHLAGLTRFDGERLTFTTELCERVVAQAEEIREGERRVRERESRITELECAVNWALGCYGDFPSRGERQGAYYWRKELAARATLKYENGRGRYVHDLVTHFERHRTALQGKPDAERE